MNKIFLIGNGFDKAHNLPTLYSEFIKSLFIERVEDKERKTWPLFNLNHGLPPKQSLVSWIDGWDQLKKEKNLNKIISELQTQLHKTLQPFRVKGDVQGAKPKEPIQCKNAFFRQILDADNIHDWADFELTYFKNLSNLVFQYEAKLNKEYALQHQERQLSHLIKKVTNLNQEFEEIKQVFVRYIKQVDADAPNDIVFDFEEIFEPHDNMGELDYETGEYTKVGVDQVLILNFNMTNTLKAYGYTYRSPAWNYLPIHGNVNNEELDEEEQEMEEDKIVFGYGDEANEAFSIIQSLDSGVFQEYSKARHYSINNNYQRAMAFIESGDYQVDIIGHSCGATDRVFLKHLFENPRCKWIRIHYYENEAGYFKVHNNITRVFGLDRQQELREKIIPFKNSTPCPQWDDED